MDKKQNELVNRIAGRLVLWSGFQEDWCLQFARQLVTDLKLCHESAAPPPAETPERAELLTYEQIYDMVKPEMSLPVFLGRRQLADMVKVRDAQAKVCAGRIQALEKKLADLDSECNTACEVAAKLGNQLIAELELKADHAQAMKAVFEEIESHKLKGAENRTTPGSEFLYWQPLSELHWWQSLKSKHLNGGAK